MAVQAVFDQERSLVDRVRAALHLWGRQASATLCGDPRMGDRVQCLACLVVGEDVVSQFLSIERSVGQQVPEPKGPDDLGECLAPRGDDLTSDSVGVDDRNAELAKHLCDCALSTRNSAGESNRGGHVCVNYVVKRTGSKRSSLAAIPRGTDAPVRAVAQRVREASVTVDGGMVGVIQRGLLVYLGAGRGDTDADVTFMADKLAGLRIFEDDAGKMSRSVTDIRAEVLVVPQFTLFGDVRKGRRPSFDDAAQPEEACVFYEGVVARLRQLGLTVATGQFRASMDVRASVDGPVTILIDSRKVF